MPNVVEFGAEIQSQAVGQAGLVMQQPVQAGQALTIEQVARVAQAGPVIQVAPVAPVAAVEIPQAPVQPAIVQPVNLTPQQVVAAPQPVIQPVVNQPPPAPVQPVVQAPIPVQPVAQETLVHPAKPLPDASKEQNSFAQNLINQSEEAESRIFVPVKTGAVYDLNLEVPKAHWNPVCFYDKAGGENGTLVKGIVFLKTHKTGSSTMTNIIMRHADKYNQSVALPAEDRWELGGYPAHIDARLLEPQDLERYQVLSHHFRLDIPAMREIVPFNTKAITIIREPVSNVESAFGFYRDQQPLNDWMPDIDPNDRIEKFYDNPSQYYKTDTDWFYRTKNQMMFDMGYDVSRDDDEYINNAIQELDKYFDLVLLTDYFDESLVMLRSLMCWSWHDVIYIKFKMRTEEAKSKISPELEEKIKIWNRADVKMYNYFNQTFWKKAESFGIDRLYKEVEELRAEIKKAEKRCIERYEPFANKPWLLHAKLRRTQSPTCKRLSWSELVYSEFLRTKMYKNFGLEKQTAEEKAKQLELFEQVQNAALRKA